jgi:hypothetical protein
MQFVRSDFARYFLLSLLSYLVLYLDNQSHLMAASTFLFFALTFFCAMLVGSLANGRAARYLMFIVASVVIFNGLGIYLAREMNLTQKLGESYTYVSGSATTFGIIYNSGVCFAVCVGLLLGNITIGAIQRRV